MNRRLELVIEKDFYYLASKCNISFEISEKFKVWVWVGYDLDSHIYIPEGKIKVQTKKKEVEVQREKGNKSPNKNWKK